MVRQDKTRSGRITPKGGDSATGASRQPVNIDGRFATLVPIIMAVCLVAGTLVIMVNYIFLSSPNNLYLLAGLGLVLAGIVAATQWD